LKEQLQKIAFGGGCHWCTEAIFQSISGVVKVEQGYVASTDENSSFSEAVIVHFNMECVKLNTLIEIHLLTHNSRSNHSMRSKFRSAIYTFDSRQHNKVISLMQDFQNSFVEKFVTEVLPFQDFKPSREAITNYYYNNPKKPFCETFINPKLILLMQRFSNHINPEKVHHLQLETNTVE
jgi:peptide-methionine (S)-S-oxide reductase